MDMQLQMHIRTGKPIARWGRKVMGLRISVQQTARLPKHNHLWQFLFLQLDERL
jgi:hypothetical protein